MIGTVDLAAMEAHIANASAEVRFAPVRGDNPDAAGEDAAAFLRGLAASRDEFGRVAEEIAAKSVEIAEVDGFLSDEERALTQRLLGSLRRWAPRFASLHASEAEPLVRLFLPWFRSYNDALTKLVRTMVDSAITLETRLAEERQDDAWADEWAKRNPPLRGDEETVSLDDVMRNAADVDH